MEALELHIEETLFQLMELEVEDEIIQMSQLFASLLKQLQQYKLIDMQLNCLVNIDEQLPETAILLVSITEVKQLNHRRGRLTTYRDFIKMWLRKNKRFKVDYLPQLF